MEPEPKPQKQRLFIEKSDCVKLERATVQIVEAFGTDRLRPLFLEHLHYSFVVNGDVFRTTIGSTRSTHNAEQTATKSASLAAQNPDWWNEAWNTTSLPDSVTGHITVLVSATLHGYGSDLACQSVHQMRWARRRGGWKAVEYHFVNGGGTLPH